MTTNANSLIPLGAGLMVGLTARPFLTRRQEMIIQLEALRSYSEGRLMANLRGRRTVQGAGANPPPGGALPRRTGAHHSMTALRLEEVGRVTAKGAAPGKGVFATDYVPVLGGRTSRVLPYETMYPQPKPPQRPPTRLCPAHQMSACSACKLRKRGTRNCCAAGHHNPAYVRRLRVNRCLQHDMGACAGCRKNKRGTRYCCAMGHHGGTRRRPGPKKGQQAPVAPVRKNCDWGRSSSMGRSSSPPPKRPRRSTSGLVLGSAGREGPGGRPPVHGGQASVSVHTNSISNVGGARPEVVGSPRRAEVEAGGLGTGE